MRKFSITKKVLRNSTIGLITGAMLAVSGCQAQEVLNFYKALTAASQFTNYQYTLTADCAELGEYMQKAMGSDLDGIALTGIVTDSDAFSVSLQARINNEYKPFTQLVVRDNKIYLDLGAVLDFLQVAAPQMYANSVQPSLDKLRGQINNATPEQLAELESAIAPYGVSLDDIKTRLNSSLGWVSVSFSAVDTSIDEVKNTMGAAVKETTEALPIQSLTEFSEDNITDGIVIFAKKLGESFEKRFSAIQPAFADVNKDAGTYTFHLSNDNIEAFLEGCLGFANEDLLPLIDASVTAMNDVGLKSAADALTEAKKSLTEEKESYDYETGETVKTTALNKAINGLQESINNIKKDGIKGQFDFMSELSLKGSEGGREWKSVNRVYVKPDKAESVPGDDYGTYALSSAPTFDEVTVTFTITMQEFKDATEALSKMADPSGGALSLDTAAEAFSKNLKNIGSTMGGMSQYSGEDYSGDDILYSNPGYSGSEWGSYEYSGPLDLSNAQVYDANGNLLTPIGSDDTTDTSSTAQEGTKDYGSILTYENFEEYVNVHPEEEADMAAWFETDAGQAWFLGYYEWYMNQLSTDTPATTTSSDPFASSSSSPAFATGDVATANTVAKQIFDTLNVALSSLKTQGVSFNAYSKISGGHSYSAGSYDYWETEGLTNVTGTDAFGDFGSARASDTDINTLEKYLAYQLVESGTAYNQECGYVAVVNPNGDLVSVAVTLESSVLSDGRLPSYDSDGKVSSSWTGVSEYGYIVGTYNNPSL